MKNNQSEENQQPSIQQGILNNSSVDGNLMVGSITQNVNPIPSVQRPRNEKRLLQDVKKEVAGKLKQSLHNAILINLGKEAQPEQVKCLWSSDIKIGDKKREAIPDETSILEVFDREEIAGKLLILGSPGAGKTTTMLNLAKALVVRSQEDCDYPIPVLFNLSTWKDNEQSIRDWLVAKLNSKYGVRKDIGANWADDAKLLPMLDGLDELESVHQEPCVRKINEFLQSDSRSRYMVICSRREEYEKVVRGQWEQEKEKQIEKISSRYNTRLYLNGAICLQALNPKQIQNYLYDLKRVEIWDLVKHDSNLLDFIKVPFFLNIVTITLGQISTDTIHDLEYSSYQIFRHFINTYFPQILKNIQSTYFLRIFIENYLTLFLERLWKRILIQNYQIFFIDEYIHLMLTRDIQNEMGKEHISIEKTKRYLSWLAKQLQREGEYDFLIENIQPDWLSNKFYGVEKIAYALICIPLFVLILLLGPGLHATASVGILLPEWPSMVYSWCQIGGIIWGLSAPFSKINTFERIYFELHLSKIAKIVSFAIVNEIFIFIILNNQFIFTSSTYLLAYVLFTNFKSSDIKTKTKANEGIWISFKNSIIVGFFVFFAVCIPLLFHYTVQSSVNFWFAIIDSVTGGFSTALIAALFTGGYAFIRHFLLRWILRCLHYIPWDYACFLNYCTDRLLLQRIGGRYRFIHRFLRERFAAIPLGK